MGQRDPQRECILYDRDPLVFRAAHMTYCEHDSVALASIGHCGITIFRTQGIETLYRILHSAHGMVTIYRKWVHFYIQRYHVFQWAQFFGRVERGRPDGGVPRGARSRDGTVRCHVASCTGRTNREV